MCRYAGGCDCELQVGECSELCMGAGMCGYVCVYMCRWVSEGVKVYVRMCV